MERVSVHHCPPCAALTEKGQAQAEAAGRRLRAIVGSDPLLFFVSPYERTRGTFRCLLRGMAPLDGEGPAPTATGSSLGGATPSAAPATHSGGTSVGCGIGGSSGGGRRTRIIGVREEPRLRELDFGNWQDPAQVAAMLKSRDRFSKVRQLRQ